MDPATLTALVAAACNALVNAVVTDSWEDVRHKIASWFGRGKVDPKTLDKLDRTYAELTAAASGDLERMQQDLAREWAGRFRDLIGDYPDAAGELAALVEQVGASMPVTAANHAVASGRDVNVTAEHGSVAAGMIHGDVSVGPTRPGPASS